MAWFSLGFIFFLGIELKKKKLTDIRFLLAFPGLKERFLFNGFGFAINVC